MQKNIHTSILPEGMLQNAHFLKNKGNSRNYDKSFHFYLTSSLKLFKNVPVICDWKLITLTSAFRRPQSQSCTNSCLLGKRWHPVDKWWKVLFQIPIARSLNHQDVRHPEPHSLWDSGNRLLLYLKQILPALHISSQYWSWEQECTALQAPKLKLLPCPTSIFPSTD